MKVTTMARLLVLAALVAVGAGTAGAQRLRVHDSPARPTLYPGADTNSANAYYTHGITRLEENPAEAAAAFYWASRINPGWADPLYARRIALLMGDRRRLIDYIEGKRFIFRDREVLAIDSLHLKALTLDPFLFQKLDKHLLRRYWLELFTEASRDHTGTPDRALASFAVERMIGTAEPFMRAWLAYSEGRFPAAIEEYERELGRSRRKTRLRTDVARLHFLSGNNDKAAEHLRLAIEEMAREERRDLVYVYENKALLEHSLATVHLKTGDRAAAREAFGRALTEDLAYYPAHLRLSEMALQDGDTATALSEMALAVDLAPGNAAIRHAHALLLLRAKRVPDAAAELAKAVELEPHFAAPYFVLGALHEQSGMRDQALEHYRSFLARAARDDAQRAAATGRVAALQNAAAAPTQ